MAPAAGRNAGGGEPAGLDRDRLAAAVVGPGTVVVGDMDAPVLPRCGAGGGDVAANRDEYAAVAIATHRGGGAVGGPGFGGGAKVERDPARDADGVAGGVELHGAPAAVQARVDDGRGAECSSVHGWGRFEQAPVAVIAGEHQRGADGRVDVAVGELGGAQRDLEGGDE